MRTPGLLRRSFEQIRPRMTPSLVILGAQKAGTSALFKMLSLHPKAAPPKRKEHNFFSNDEAYALGFRHYRSQFPAVPARSHGHFTFEASPSYLFNAAASAPRIAMDLPKAYCVAVLRDPVKRAHSAWNMFRDFGNAPERIPLHDPRSFARAIEDELAGRTENHWHKYLMRGKYADQVAEFQKHIPSDRFWVRSYLDLKRDPVGLVAEICRTLGQDPLPRDHPAFTVRANRRAYPETLDEGLAKELYQYFAPEMVKLRNVLGYDLNIMEGHG